MDINFWSVIVAAIVAFVIGAIWYSPILFGKEWMEMTGVSDDDMSRSMSTRVIGYYIIQLIVTLVTFIVLGFAMSFAGVSDASDGAIIGILAWLGLVLPNHIGSLMWEKRPVKFFLINTVYSLLTLVVGGAIIGAW